MSASAERNLTAISGGAGTASRSANSQPSHHSVSGVPSAASAAAAAFHPHLRLLTDLSNATSPHHPGAGGAPTLVNVNTPLTAALSSYLRPPGTHPQLHQRHGGFLPAAGSASTISGTLAASNTGARDNSTSGSGTAAVIKSPMATSSVGVGSGRDNRLEFYPHHLVG